MASNRQIDIEIDKLTRSVENAITGDSFLAVVGVEAQAMVLLPTNNCSVG